MLGRTGNHVWFCPGSGHSVLAVGQCAPSVWSLLFCCVLTSLIIFWYRITRQYWHLGFSFFFSPSAKWRLALGALPLPARVRGLALWDFKRLYPCPAQPQFALLSSEADGCASFCEGGAVIRCNSGGRLSSSGGGRGLRQASLTPLFIFLLFLVSIFLLLPACGNSHRP